MIIINFYIQIISGIVAYSLLAYFYFKNFTKNMIFKIGINDKYLMKYVEINDFIKRHFKIKEKTIPRFLYFECYFSLFFIVLLIIEIIFFIFSCYDIFYIIILYYILMIKSISIIINSIWFSILCILYQDKLMKIKIKIRKIKESIRGLFFDDQSGDG